MKTIITKSVELKPLTTPNFVLTEPMNETIPIGELSEIDLRLLGVEFTENLVAKAKSMKK